MNPTEWAAFVLACLSITAILIGGVRYIIQHEVPKALQGSDIVSRIDRLETLFMEWISDEREKTIKKRTRRSA